MIGAKIEGMQAMLFALNVVESLNVTICTWSVGVYEVIR